VPRVVPSDVVKAADAMFPDMVKTPTAFPAVGPDTAARLMVLAELVDVVAPELVTLKPERYAALIANVAYIRSLNGAFLAGLKVLNFNLHGYEHNPVATIRDAMALCPDETPSAQTVTLAFIADSGLRESIRLDISAANQDLAEGEWKGATVLAGSAVEALLLWTLQEHEKTKPGVVPAAVASLVGSKTLKGNPGGDLEGPGWRLHEYVEVSAHMGVIKSETATLVRLAKDFRNLIHPGRAARLGQKCDRATALGALAAAEAVARDLTP
jgi:hypothetical protein